MAENESMGTSLAAELWNVSQGKVCTWCRQGKIKGAVQDAPGKPWHIPKDTPNPFA